MYEATSSIDKKKVASLPFFFFFFFLPSELPNSHMTQMAVKKMPFRSEKEKNLSLMEINYLRILDHPNVVKYLRAYECAELGEIWVPK